MHPCTNDVTSHKYLFKLIIIMPPSKDCPLSWPGCRCRSVIGSWSSHLLVTFLHQGHATACRTKLRKEYTTTTSNSEYRMFILADCFWWMYCRAGKQISCQPAEPGNGPHTDGQSEEGVTGRGECLLASCKLLGSEVNSSVGRVECWVGFRGLDSSSSLRCTSSSSSEASRPKPRRGHGYLFGERQQRGKAPDLLVEFAEDRGSYSYF